MTISQIAAVVCRADLGHPTRVAIDGVTASGKSTLAREVCDAVAALGRPVVHLTMDGYHHPREHRYRQGRMSARGYYDDAYDFTAFAAHVLIPLGPGGDRRYRERIIDLPSDERRDEPLVEALADAVLSCTGITGYMSAPSWTSPGQEKSAAMPNCLAAELRPSTSTTGAITRPPAFTSNRSARPNAQP